MKILHLTVKRCWFDLIADGRKVLEYRRPSDWIKSRLAGKGGVPKVYGVVRFRDGYSATARTVDVRYCGYAVSTSGSTASYNNGLMMYVPAGTYIIMLGDVISQGVERQCKQKTKKTKKT